MCQSTDNTSDGVKAREPKAKTTSIKAKAVIHKTKAKVFLIKAAMNKQNINVCCVWWCYRCVTDYRKR